MAKAGQQYKVVGYDRKTGDALVKKKRNYKGAAKGAAGRIVSQGGAALVGGAVGAGISGKKGAATGAILGSIAGGATSGTRQAKRAGKSRALHGTIGGGLGSVGASGIHGAYLGSKAKSSPTYKRNTKGGTQTVKNPHYNKSKTQRKRSMSSA